VQLCKKVDQWTANCDADDDFPARTRANRKASILQLGPEDAWIEMKH